MEALGLRGGSCAWTAAAFATLITPSLALIPPPPVHAHTTPAPPRRRRRRRRRTQKVKGQALSFGVFADSWGGANAREVLVQSWRQARGGAVYIAAQFFDEADGLPPAAGGKFLAKLDAGASAASALTAQDPRVAGVQCGFAPV